MMKSINPYRLILGSSIAGALLVTAACAPGEKHAPASVAEQKTAGTVYLVRDTTVQASFDAAGVASAIQRATLSTRLMGAVTSVLVKEGDVVSPGQVLVRIDARDIDARNSQVAATIAEAEAVHLDALTQARRIRALYADSAAARAQLDAAETGLARAEADVRSARAASAEIGAARSYSVIRAPFGGVVTERFVDNGSFAAPGAPLVTIQDGRELRITASATPDIAKGIRRGQTLDATIEGRPFRAAVEGLVPSSAGNLYTINALVKNANEAVLPGSAAVLTLPTGTRRALLVPIDAVIREGDLTGVTVRTDGGDERRWVRLGANYGENVEVVAGLQSGDRVVVPVKTARVASRD